MKRAALALLLTAGCRPAESDAGRPVSAADLAPPAPQAPRASAALVSFPDGSRLEVEVAATPQARERGLMDRQRLGPDEGMLFVFESEQTLGFWMKNTYVDLDMLWLDASGRVTTLHENVPRSTPGMSEAEVATRSGRGLYVLELAAGQARRRKALPGSVLGLELREP